MIIDLTRLKSDIDKEILIDEIYTFSEEELKGLDVLKLENVNIKGKINKNSRNEYELFLNVYGVMVLPCAITLKPVDYEFNIDISGNLEILMQEIDETLKKLENSIDILPIIWENILMEIPMKVVSEEAKDIKLEGDGWRLLTDDKIEDINPEFQKLSKLFEEK